MSRSPSSNPTRRLPSVSGSSRQASCPASLTQIKASGASPNHAHRVVTRRLPTHVQSLPIVRAIIQGIFLVIMLVAGLELYVLYRQAITGQPLTVARPPVVEGFLPISALVGLKHLMLTGQWDDVHPAGLTILLSAMVGSLVARKAFCAWICPIGTVERALAALGSRLGWRRNPARPFLVPRALDLALMAPKYLLLAFFVWAVLLQMDGGAVEAFLHTPYNRVADVKMLLFFVDLSTTAATVLVVLVLLSVVIKNFWCRYLCPYGALLGLIGVASPLKLERNPERCTDCQRCTRVCPNEIQVHTRSVVRSPECVGCMSCVANCSASALDLRVGRSRPLSPYMIPALAVGIMLLAWAIARVTGHWVTRVPLEWMVSLYQHAPFLGHP